MSANLVEKMVENATNVSKGANNLSKILAEKFSGSLYTTIDKLKKQKTYKIHKATLPFEGCAVTEGRKAIRNIFNAKPAKLSRKDATKLKV